MPMFGVMRHGAHMESGLSITQPLTHPPPPPPPHHSSHIQGDGTNEDVRLVWQSDPAPSTRTLHLFVMGIIRPTRLQNNPPLCLSTLTKLNTHHVYQCARYTSLTHANALPLVSWSSSEHLQAKRLTGEVVTSP